MIKKINVFILMTANFAESLFHFSTNEKKLKQYRSVLMQHGNFTVAQVFYH